MKPIKYLPLLILPIVLNITCNNKHVSLVNTDIEIVLQHSIIRFKMPVIIKYSTRPVPSDYNDDIDYEHNYQFITNNDTEKIEFKYLLRGKINYRYENDTIIFKNMEDNIHMINGRGKYFVRTKKIISGQSIYILYFNNGFFIENWSKDDDFTIYSNNINDMPLKKAIAESITIIN